jgi:two-component system CheB/CheR fusion protein
MVVERQGGPRFVVGVGASAGGLEAIEGFLRAVPADTGMAFLIVQHLSPDHKSHMVERLAKHTPMRVVSVEDGMPILRDTVYLLPPRKVLAVRDGKLRLEDRGAGLTLPVDILFRSLAEEYGERTAAVVLSGTGTDGMRGVRAIGEAGGLIAIQDPATAKFDGMPRAAISVGLADYVLPVHELPARIGAYAVHRERARAAPVAAPSFAGGAYDELTELVRRQTGIDFGQYKPSTVNRRIQRRMAINLIDNIEDYVALARSSSREVAGLFKELLISVTRFFRDVDAFEVLRREVIPQIASHTRLGEGIRVWVAGCATGEEAYSLAMLFEEYVDEGGRPRDVKIFATDIDRDALEFAGLGIYPESIAADVSQERLARFFVRRGESFQVARFLRQRVVFANHDVTRDPPFSRVALVSCRNLLIYLGAAMQAQVIAGFRFALRPGGYLFLGSSETPGELGDELETVNAPAKLYSRTQVRSRVPDVRQRATASAVGSLPWTPQVTAASVDQSVREAADALLHTYAPPSVLITEQHDVLHFFGQPSPLLRFGAGAASLNLLSLLPPALASVVSMATHRALRDDAAATYRSALGGGAGTATVTAQPLAPRGSSRCLLVSLGVAAELAEAPRATAGELPADAERQIVDLQQELQFSRESLQASIEELETSNEELQAANEELVASNEELQSTNEELQSVNEELHTLNSEHQRKIAELVRLNDDINNLLLSTRLGSVFLDEDLVITRFTPAIAQVMNLMPRDVGRPIGHLSLRFDPAVLFAAIDEVRRARQPVERSIALSDDAEYVLRVAPYVTEAGSASAGVVVTVLDVTSIKQAERQLARVLDALPFQIALLDAGGTIRLVNRAWVEFGRSNGGQAGAAGPGVSYFNVCQRAASDAPEAARAAALFGELLTGSTRVAQLEYPCHSDSEQRWFIMQASRVEGPELGIVVSHLDITARKRFELAVAQAPITVAAEAEERDGGE